MFHIVAASPVSSWGSQDIQGWPGFFGYAMNIYTNIERLLNCACQVERCWFCKVVSFCKSHCVRDSSHSKGICGWDQVYRYVASIFVLMTWKVCRSRGQERSVCIDIFICGNSPSLQDGITMSPSAEVCPDSPESQGVTFDVVIEVRTKIRNLQTATTSSLRQTTWRSWPACLSFVFQRFQPTETSSILNQLFLVGEKRPIMSNSMCILFINRTICL